MQLFSWDDIISSYKSEKSISLFANGTGLSIGSFDGLHLGHRALLQDLVQNCGQRNLLPVVISFTRPLPGIKHHENYQGDVSTLNQRLELFEKLGIHAAVIINFTEEFASLSGTDFLNIMIKVCHMKFIAEGVDFRFGYKGATDVSALNYFAKNNDIDTSFVEQVIFKDGTEEERVSSSYIRSMISKGFLSTVAQLLQRPYELEIPMKAIQTESKKDGMQAFYVLKESINQVIPPDKVYFCKDDKNQNINVKITEDKIYFPEKTEKIVF